MSRQPIYGFPHVTDPHDFHPDHECCSPAEMEAHRLACANYGKPSPNKGCMRTSWGIGTNLVRCCDECKEPAEAAMETATEISVSIAGPSIKRGMNYE